MSLFITFEGGEGCGKSLQSRTLSRRLAELAIPAILIYEPGGTPLGDRIRRLLKRSGDISISPLAELMLFNASRTQLINEVIHPAMNERKVVICDRFADSTVAYQSYGRRLDITTVKAVNQIATQGLKPDVTFLLDIPPELGLARKNPQAQDRFEQEAITFHQQVREGFLKLAAEEPQRWVVIDSTLSKSKIAGIIWEKISLMIGQGRI